LNYSSHHYNHLFSDERSEVDLELKSAKAKNATHKSKLIEKTEARDELEAKVVEMREAAREIQKVTQALQEVNCVDEADTQIGRF
jgi:uncharacterized protein YhaN